MQHEGNHQHCRSGRPLTPPCPGVWCPTSTSTHLPDSATLHHGSKAGFRNAVSRMSSRPGGRGLLGAVHVWVAPPPGIRTPRAPDTGYQGDKITPVKNLHPKQTGKMVVSRGRPADDQPSKKPAGRVQQHVPLCVPCLFPASPVFTAAS